MKRSIVIIGFGVLLMLTLYVLVEGAGKKSDHKAPTRTEQKPQPSKSIARTVTTPASLPDAQAPVSMAARPATEAAAASANYEIPWQTVNAGGAPCASDSYGVNASVGQSTIGHATSTNYEAGIGYWYGTAGDGGCDCPFQSDFDADGFITALDLASEIDALFSGGPDPTDPNCPTSRGDFDIDGFNTALDLAGLIDHLFSGGPGPSDPCAP